MEALRTMQLFNDSLSFPKITFNKTNEHSVFTMLIKHLEREYLNDDAFSIGITRSILHIVITKLFRIKANTSHFIERKKYIPQFLAFQEIVEQECFESKQVQYYAKKMGVSTKTLNNICNDVVNISAKAFIDERTIMQIKRLLISTNYSIKEIAYRAGFNDPTNFYKYFKKFTDYSPEVFRQAH